MNAATSFRCQYNGIMDLPYPPAYEAATPEYVLAVVQDELRQYLQFCPELYIDSDWQLSFETTSEEVDQFFAYSRTLLSKGDVSLNEFWGLNLPKETWLSVLLPAREKQLRGLCELVATHIRRPVIRPVCFFDRPCLAAGSFLTIRSLLHEAGVNVETIAPSTPLAEYTRRHGDVFLKTIARLNPGCLPRVRIDKPIPCVCAVFMLLGLLTATAGLCSGELGVLGFGSVLAIVGWVTMWFTGTYLLPESVGFGELRTFRDLAVVMAEESK
jgi:hypothetical protein